MNVMKRYPRPHARSNVDSVHNVSYQDWSEKLTPPTVTLTGKTALNCQTEQDKMSTKAIGMRNKSMPWKSFAHNFTWEIENLLKGTDHDPVDLE